MELQFTPNGSMTSTTIGNDAANYPIVTEKAAGDSLVQIENLPGGANPVLFPRQNVSGDYIFRSAQSFASTAAAWAQWITFYNLINQQGTLLGTEGAQLMIYANAVLKSAERLFDSGSTGVRLAVRWTFKITTLQT